MIDLYRMSGQSFQEGIGTVESQQPPDSGSIDERIAAPSLQVPSGSMPSISNIKPKPATSLPAQAAQARLAQLQANMGGLQGLAVSPQLGGLPNINFRLVSNHYIYD